MQWMLIYNWFLIYNGWKYDIISMPIISSTFNLVSVSQINVYSVPLPDVISTWLCYLGKYNKYDLIKRYITPTNLWVPRHQTLLRRCISLSRSTWCSFFFTLRKAIVVSPLKWYLFNCLQLCLCTRPLAAVPVVMI